MNNLHSISTLQKTNLYDVFECIHLKYAKYHYCNRTNIVCFKWKTLIAICLKIFTFLTEPKSKQFYLWLYHSNIMGDHLVLIFKCISLDTRKCNFAATDNHGSTIENTVFIDVDKHLLNHRHQDLYCDSAHQNYSHPFQAF